MIIVCPSIVRLNISRKYMLSGQNVSGIIPVLNIPARNEHGYGAKNQ
jgi:hypothetical protein